MRYYPSDGPTPEQELASDYESLREHCDKLEDIVLKMVEINDPTQDVADAVSFYDAWCREATALLHKPSVQRLPAAVEDDENPF